MQELGTPTHTAALPPCQFGAGVTDRFNSQFLTKQALASPTGTPLDVMMVEDSDSVRAVLRHMINKISGLSLGSESTHAAAALARLQCRMPDIVLLDIQLQGESGMPVLRSIVGCPTPAKVIVVSNYADEVYRKHYLHAGAHAFFDKSYELKALKLMLEHLAANRPIRKGLHAT